MTHAPPNERWLLWFNELVILAGQCFLCGLDVAITEGAGRLRLLTTSAALFKQGLNQN